MAIKLIFHRAHTYILDIAWKHLPHAHTWSNEFQSRTSINRFDSICPTIYVFGVKRKREREEEKKILWSSLFGIIEHFQWHKISNVCYIQLHFRIAHTDTHMVKCNSIYIDQVKGPTNSIEKKNTALVMQSSSGNAIRRLICQLIPFILIFSQRFVFLYDFFLNGDINFRGFWRIAGYEFHQM